MKYSAGVAAHEAVYANSLSSSVAARYMVPCSAVFAVKFSVCAVFRCALCNIFNESAPRLIQSTIRNVRLQLYIYMYVCHLVFFVKVLVRPNGKKWNFQS